MVRTRASEEKRAGWEAVEVRFVLRKGWKKAFRSPKEQSVWFREKAWRKYKVI